MREFGFYWVVSGGVWHVAYWSDIFDGWYLTGCEDKLIDSDMDEIDERRIVREVE